MPRRTTKARRNKLSCRGGSPKPAGANFHVMVDHQSSSEQTFMSWWITKASRNKLSHRGEPPKPAGTNFHAAENHQSLSE
ncbi:hypothetical protein [uncultured Draconibacterium sp.]|uniref:hypothetical protein n=2 Tax=uncultured Draconibacterium sp. TaxID=1573823 RepID=UPI0032177848